MARHTQAHLNRTIKKDQAWALKERTFHQMEYYMGAKLIEIGVNPKSAIYRWSVKRKNGSQIWTYSAYWGESKERLLSGEQPLTGIELIDCARANAYQGVETAAKLCGYGEELSSFQQALKEASQQMGLEIESLLDLRGEPAMGRRGIDYSPDTSSSL